MKITNQHTPAPWSIAKDDTSDTHVAAAAQPPLIIETDDRHIAFCFDDGEQAMADARLIVSAPDMFAALEGIAALWPHNTTAKIDDVNGINDGKNRAILLEAAVTMARSAIEKVGFGGG